MTKSYNFPETFHLINKFLQLNSGLLNNDFKVRTSVKTENAHIQKYKCFFLVEMICVPLLDTVHSLNTACSFDNCVTNITVLMCADTNSCYTD